MQAFLTAGVPRWVWWFMWLSCGLLAWFNLMAGRPGLRDLRDYQVVAWVLGYLAFGAGFWWASRESGTRGGPSARSRLVLTVGMTLLVIAMSASAPNYGDHGVLLVLTAALAASQLTLPQTLLWVAAQSAAFALTLYGSEGLFGMFYLTTAFLIVKVFAISAVRAMRREAEARRQLMETNVELLATRKRLAEASRGAERMRIARELHDLLGHHLTALNMNLEVAEHLLAPHLLAPQAAHTAQALGHVQRSHALARLLLADVREAVSSLREDVPGCFEQRVRRLLQEVPGLAVHLSVSGEVSVPGTECAQALLRCIQELVTNTLRHACAKNLYLTLSPAPGGLRFEARDDGRGTGALHLGHGLRGMRERIEELGGRIDFSSGAGQGFRVRGWVPLVASTQATQGGVAFRC